MRRARRPRSLRDRFLSESLRIGIPLLVATPVSMLVVLVVVPALGGPGLEDGDEGLSAVLLLLIVAISLYSLLFSGLTYYALADQPRARLVGTARLSRVRKHVLLYRLSFGRGGAGDEVMQLLFTAALAIGLLVTRPDGVPIQVLLVVTAGAVITAWIGTVMTFAVEYAAEDSRGDAFALVGSSGPDRMFSDYLYGAVLIQASSGASDLVPLTPPARRLVRTHVILSHITSTIILTLGVSALLSSVS